MFDHFAVLQEYHSTLQNDKKRINFMQSIFVIVSNFNPMFGMDTPE
jgi:hypothetical protein